MSTAEAPRQYHMDILKGIAIYMVVMGHVLILCIREMEDAFLFKLIAEVHMPLFFFISGWFTFKRCDNGLPFRCPDLKRRALQLLLPMIVVSTIWIYIYPKTGLQLPFDSTFKGLWIAVGKNGYWFTPCLFEIIVLYAALAVLMRKLSVSTRVCMLLTVWVILLLLSELSRGDRVWSITELELVARFFPAFMAGAFARMYEHRFLEYVNRPRTYTVALAASVFLLYFICYFWKFGVSYEWTDIARGLFHITLAMVTIPLAISWTSREGALQSRAVRLWSYLGKESLAIYLLHYPFLFPMSWMQEPLRDMGLGVVPAAVVSGITAAAIIACTLAFNAVIKRSPAFALLLTGRVPHRPKNKQKVTTIVI